MWFDFFRGRGSVGAPAPAPRRRAVTPAHTQAFLRGVNGVKADAPDISITAGGFSIEGVFQGTTQPGFARGQSGSLQGGGGSETRFTPPPPPPAPPPAPPAAPPAAAPTMDYP